MSISAWKCMSFRSQRRLGRRPGRCRFSAWVKKMVPFRSRRGPNGAIPVPPSPNGGTIFLPKPFFYPGEKRVSNGGFLRPQNIANGLTFHTGIGTFGPPRRPFPCRRVEKTTLSKLYMRWEIFYLMYGFGSDDFP